MFCKCTQAGLAVEPGSAAHVDSIAIPLMVFRDRQTIHACPDRLDRKLRATFLSLSEMVEQPLV